MTWFNRHFWMGFILTLLLFLAVSLIAAHLQSDCGLPGLLKLAGCADDISRAGFPLVFYETGGFAYRNHFEVGLLGLDLVCGLGLSLLGGVLAQRFWKRASL